MGYLEICSFPTDEEPRGKGKYFVAGQVAAKFTFEEQGNGEPFAGEQEGNDVSFVLAPLVQNDKPIGFIMTFPDEFPMFEARFGMPDAARQGLAQAKAACRRQSSLGKWQEKFRNLKERQQARKKSKFQQWQDRFAAKRRDARVIREATRRESQSSMLSRQSSLVSA